jgi:hypothetical protein
MYKLFVTTLILVASLFLLSGSIVLSQELCEGNFDCDGDVDGTDAAIFKEDFGRTVFKNPCPPCTPVTTTVTTTIPGPRFTDNGNGTVTDNHSGLVWLNHPLCDDLNDSGTGLNWYDATALAASLADGNCGLTDDSVAGDWRLPTKEEWEAFVCAESQEPALCNIQGIEQWLPGDVFDVVQYWTDTPVESSTDSSWTILISPGIMFIARNSSTNYVWPVRGNSSGGSTTTTIACTPQGENCTISSECCDGCCCNAQGLNLCTSTQQCSFLSGGCN